MIWENGGCAGTYSGEDVLGKERIHLSFPPDGVLFRAFSATLTGRFGMGRVW
jgi:hypothetical protein